MYPRSRGPRNNCGCRLAYCGWRTSGTFGRVCPHHPGGSSGPVSGHPYSAPESETRWGRISSSHRSRCETRAGRTAHVRGSGAGQLSADGPVPSRAYSYIRSLGCVPRTSPSLTGFRHDGREASDGPAYPNTRHGAAATQQAAAPVFGEMVSEAWDIPLSPPPAPDKPPCCSSL